MLSTYLCNTCAMNVVDCRLDNTSRVESTDFFDAATSTHVPGLTAILDSRLWSGCGRAAWRTVVHGGFGSSAVPKMYVEYGSAHEPARLHGPVVERAVRCRCWLSRESLPTCSVHVLGVHTSNRSSTGAFGLPWQGSTPPSESGHPFHCMNSFLKLQNNFHEFLCNMLRHPTCCCRIFT